VPFFYRRALADVVDLRLLPNLVHLEADPMRRAPALDQRIALGAVEREGHDDDCLQGVALRPSGRRGIGFAREETRTEKSKTPATVSAEMPGPLSAMMISLPLSSTRIHRRRASFLSSVNRVVSQFLENHERPQEIDA
jgi:hypothetical protein